MPNSASSSIDPKLRCKAFVKHGDRCKLRALPKSDYCFIHRDVPPKPSGIWDKAVKSGELIKNIGSLYGAFETVRKVLEAVIHHLPAHHWMAATEKIAGIEVGFPELVDERDVSEVIEDEFTFPTIVSTEELHATAVALLEGRRPSHRDAMFFVNFELWLADLDEDTLSFLNIKFSETEDVERSVAPEEIEGYGEMG